MITKTLITIVGPTAIGKTALGIAFAKAYKTVIISSDSRQFYKEMTIGTAVPNREELKAATHYFIQNKSIHNRFTVADFEKEALHLLEGLFVDHDVVIMVGGSGLYEKAVTEGLDNIPEINPAIAEKVERDFKEKGIAYLQELLKTEDPNYYATVDLQNSRRLIRALSVKVATGLPFSSYLKKESSVRKFNILKIGLESPREQLYARIEKRVDLMMEQGLLQEAKELLSYKDLQALQTVGYKELFAYFEGSTTLSEAVALIKQNTRRFAKRQLTWYRKEAQIQWFNFATNHDTIIKTVAKLLPQ